MYGMIPNAKSDSLERLPPEKRFRNPRTLEPPKLFEISLTASTFTPGAGM